MCWCVKGGVSVINWLAKCIIDNTGIGEFYLFFRAECNKEIAIELARGMINYGIVVDVQDVTEGIVEV